MNAKNRLTKAVAQGILYGTPALEDAAVGAMLASGIDEDSEECTRCELAAAQLYSSGWLSWSKTEIARCGTFGKKAHKARRRAVKTAKKAMRAELIRCEIIPAGVWWWITSWAFRAFLDHLLQRWVTSEHPIT